MKGRAFFFDRDGTIIRDKNFICQYKEVEVFPFAVEALRMISQKGYLLIGITNQSSIARGICLESDVRLIHKRLIDHFGARGVPIERIYYSPFHEEGVVEKYRKSDPSRKPEPGMLLQAAADFQIDLEASYMVGDSSRDIVAGIRGGCKTALVRTGNGDTALTELKERGMRADLVADTILGIAEMLD